jgi:hypothetical protein
MKSYKQLHCWNKGMQLSLAIYRATAAFPKDEITGLHRNFVGLPFQFRATLLKDMAGILGRITNSSSQSLEVLR